MGATAPKPLLAHSSRQQADGYSGNTNKHQPLATKLSHNVMLNEVKHLVLQTERGFLSETRFFVAPLLRTTLTSNLSLRAKRSNLLHSSREIATSP